MGKRSTFTRRPQDAYDTPLAPVLPLVPHLPPSFTYWEPCGGQYDLVEHLSAAHAGAVCEIASDVKPRDGRVFRVDALRATPADVDSTGVDMIVTNPPWTRPLLHQMIYRFSYMRPTWLLFDADWMHTKQARPYLSYCQRIVAVGRVKWIADSNNTGKDNAAWYLFDQRTPGQTVFVGL
jgi:hypothetical protein